MATRDKLVDIVSGRYARGSRHERGRILDEFTALTGLNANTRCECFDLGNATDGRARGRSGDYDPATLAEAMHKPLLVDLCYACWMA